MTRTDISLDPTRLDLEELYQNMEEPLRILDLGSATLSIARYQGKMSVVVTTSSSHACAIPCDTLSSFR